MQKLSTSKDPGAAPPAVEWEATTSDEPVYGVPNKRHPGTGPRGAIATGVAWAWSIWRLDSTRLDSARLVTMVETRD